MVAKCDRCLYGPWVSPRYFRFRVPEGLFIVKLALCDDEPMILAAQLDRSPLTIFTAERIWNRYRLQKRLQALV